MDSGATRPDPNRSLILFTKWGSGVAAIVSPTIGGASMAAMIVSNGQMAGSGACVPTFNGLLNLAEEKIQSLVSDVLLVASPRTRRAVHDFFSSGQEFPKVSRQELAGLLAGYAPNFA